MVKFFYRLALNETKIKLCLTAKSVKSGIILLFFAGKAGLIFSSFNSFSFFEIVLLSHCIPFHIRVMMDMKRFSCRILILIL